MKHTLTFFGLLFAALTTTQATEPPQVTIDSGALEGTLADGIHVFKGIPYATPPVGGLRWRAPQLVAKWSGVRNATRYGNDAPQRLSLTQDEDCLYLNVWAPADAKQKPYPVMVWIHGGGLVVGSGKCAGENFARDGVVLVSFNYRLGRLGAFAHADLISKTPTDEPKGNFWLQDQIAALEWVKRNIAAFGGDPQRVTIFGVSSGGTSVNMLMLCPRAKGLFHRAIAQSGLGGFGPFRRLNTQIDEREPQTALGAAYAAKLGLDKNADITSALRSLPWKTVADLGEGESGVEPVVDGELIPDDPQHLFSSGKQHAVPFIAGANSFEGTLALAYPWGDQPPKSTLIAALPQIAPLYGKTTDDPALMPLLYGDVFFRLSARSLIGHMQRVSTPAWFYHFDYVRVSQRKGSRGAGHGAEVPYVFGDVPFFPAEQDQATARTIHAHWIAFAKSANPNAPGLPEWPAFTSAAPNTMHYSADGIRAVPELDKAKFDLLTSLLHQLWPDEGKWPAKTEPKITPKPAAPAARLSAESEAALRKQVTTLFEATRTGDITQCLALSDPEALAKHGRPTAEKFFTSIGNLMRLTKITAADHRIHSIQPAPDQQSATVQTEVRLAGKWQPPGRELWIVREGVWRYQETKN